MTVPTPAPRSAVARLSGWRRGKPVPALAVPLGSALLAYAMWALSERFMYWGPFDRATFGWVVLAVWGGGTLITGWIWSFLGSRTRTLLAALLWLIEGGIAAATFFAVVVTETQGCETSPRTLAAGWIVPSFVIGIIIGGIPALAALASSTVFAEGRPRWAIVAGVGTILVGVVVFAFAFSMILLTVGGCNRP